MNTIDLQISEFIVGLRNPICDAIFTFVAHLGDVMIVWIILALVLLYKSKKLKQLMYIIPIAAIGSIINSLIIKPIIKRPRPFIQSDLIIPLVNEASFSMPSGHSMSSFLAATLLAYYFPKYKYCFFVLATLIAFSRVYVGVHFTSDVIVGSIIGCLFAKIGLYFVSKLKTSANN